MAIHQLIGNYLRHIDISRIICLIEDFSWEEFYVLVPGHKREYEILKKTQPSYTDVFKMIKISSHVDTNHGLFPKLQRLSDGKRFELPLMDLRTIDLESVDYQRIEDHSNGLLTTSKLDIGSTAQTFKNLLLHQI